MNPTELERHELIGLICEVVDAENKNLIGIKGKIIDETRNTLQIQTSKEKKVIIKNQVTLKVTINNKTIQINGEKLVKRPEERIKDETKEKKHRN